MDFPGFQRICNLRFWLYSTILISSLISFNTYRIWFFPSWISDLLWVLSILNNDRCISCGFLGRLIWACWLVLHVPCSLFFLDFGRHFPFLNFFPAFSLFRDLYFGAVSLKIPMLVTVTAFEWKLFIISLLVMVPISNFQFNCLRQPCFQVKVYSYLERKLWS